MKFLKNILISAIFSGIIGTTAFAGTVITAPIDSRPVSNEYLKNLVEINGDRLLYPQSKNLDIFSGGKNDHFANSNEIRKDIKSFVAKNNNEDTTVIINSSTYFTGGLVGSRNSSQYNDIEKGIDELYSLINTYKKPSYYINIAMPRNLPDSRGGAIWSDDGKSLYGIGHFYNYDDKSEVLDYIKINYDVVSPSEFLLEWGYVYNKSFEKGVENISDWEREFLKYCDEIYSKDEYKQYMNNYKKIFSETAEIFKSIMRWQRAGLLTEIIIGNDDLQLPDFIYYMNNNSDNKDWIDTVNGSPVKYSFSRHYMKSDNDSIYANIEKQYGKNEALKAATGTSDNVNILCGMDEIPQLIYASDVVKRENKYTDIKLYGADNVSSVDDYDVKNASEISKIYTNFVMRKANEKGDTLHIFIYDYKTQNSPDKTVKEIESLIDKNENVGLIELFDYSQTEIVNTVFDTLVKDGYILNLSCYSGWNTNANAIGLGIAQGEVYSLSEPSKENILLNTNLLLRHIFEDGVYTTTGKREIISEQYVITENDMVKSERLKKIFNDEDILRYMINDTVSKDEFSVKIKNITLKDYNFPWKRNFECYIDFNIEEEK